MTLFNTAKSRSKSSGKNYFILLLLLSNLSSNFVENIFCMIHSKLESHNLIYITVANSGGKMRHIASFKNSYFHEILIWKTLKPVITLWLSPGKIEQHCLGLKLLTCPAEVFWPNILQLCLELDLLHNFSNHSTGFSLIEYFIDVNIQWYQDEISPLDLNTKATIWWLRKIKTAGQEEGMWRIKQWFCFVTRVTEVQTVL